MKAIFITRYGGPEVLELRQAPEAQPKPGQVVVRVEAAGVNFADILATRGSYPGTPEPPFIAGREFAGVVEDTGERVMGYTQSRAFAERIAVRPQLLWPAPAGWSAAEAAAFPVNYFTAYFAYWKAGLLAAGPERESRGDPPRVLIHAVAGGVGTAAVEIGKLLGAEMYGTSSSEGKLARARQLGLQHGINYKAEDYERRIQELTAREGVDAVFEMLGGEHTARSIRCLKFLGRVVLYGTVTGVQPQFDMRELYAKQASVHGLWLSPLSLHPEMMQPAWEEMSVWIQEGKLRPIVGHTLPLEQAGDAYRLLLERKNFGKVVLTVSN
jgi:NADPH2:quinone reductase